MATHDVLRLGLALVMGVVIGAVFFGGLWWTVRRGVASKHPGLWFGGSLLVRTAFTLLGFFVVSNGRAERLLACVAGFAVASLVVTRMTRPAPRAQEVDHAP